MSSVRTVPADPALPRLAMLFDLPAMAAELDRVAVARTGADWRVAGCEIERIKYRPRRNCLVGYRVLARRQGSARAVERRVAVAMYTGDEAGERARRAQVAAGEQVALHAGLGAVVSLFPQDRKIAALPLLTNPRSLAREVLPAMVTARFGAGARLLRTRTSVLSWFPEHTCTVRADLTVATTAGAQVPWRIYGHARHDDASAAAFAAMRRLHGDAACAAAGLAFARPLAYDGDRRMLWQEGIDAPTLDATLARRDDGARRILCARVVRALAALHRTRHDAARQLPAPALADLERAARTIGQAAPGCAAAAGALAAELARGAASLAPATRAMLHGDLHGNNVLVDDRRVYLIDLDQIGSGDPLQELGSLLAEWASRDCIAGHGVAWAPLAEAIESYRSQAPWSCTDADVRWHVASALLRERGLRAVTSLKPGRIQALPALLAAATSILRGTA